MFLRVEFHAFLGISCTQVDEAAFAVLQDCIISGDFDTCESIPNGGEGYLVNPLGGMAVDLGSPCG